MNSKALKTLEYDKIIEILTGFAVCSAGKEKCRNLKPDSRLDIIMKNQDETSDALTHLVTQGEPGFTGVKDISDSLNRLKLGASLNTVELLEIAGLLRCSGTIKNYFRAKVNDDDSTGDSLDEYYQGLVPAKKLSDEIVRCIKAEDEIADDASPELFDIRRKIKNISGKVHEVLNVILSSKASLLQESVITQRDGRYCLPVKAENRSVFKGTVHDRSATGSTLFIEPQAVISLNNQIRELEAEEKTEIEKILAVLSNMCAEESQTIKIDFDILSTLDFIFAKAKYSRSIRASRPIIKSESTLNLKKARHPLLDKESCVPIDVRLGEDYNMLIITGPNTGGKTVSLKTIGLLTLMGQAGLHIPAFDNSSLKLFDEVYADIGDEQSIEQSLSTFSSHMVNTVKILKKANERSLVLFDELGAGTDPVEGAALATAILSTLHEKKICACATTHYSELKIYALTTAGVMNASCEFDVEKLAPTYKLLIGVPGKSNAFAISKKLGLSDAILKKAEENIATEEKNFEDVISDLESTKLKLDKEKMELSKKRREVSKLERELREKNEKIDSAKKKILDNANREASDILSDAKKVADETIRDFTKWAQTNPDVREMEEKRRSIGEKIKKTDKSRGLAEGAKKPKKKVKSSEIISGMDVHVLSMNQDASVLTLPDRKGNMQVQIGIIKTSVNINDIEIIKKKPEKNPVVNRAQSTGSGKIKYDKAKNIGGEINLIGLNTQEALPELDKYLDDAYLAGLSQVRVVHGRGTGALRNAVQNRLKKLKYVDSYRNGEFGEGDMGVTIVTFK